MTRWKPNDIRRNGGYRIIGHVWMRDRNGEFRRQLLRQFKKSGVHDWCELIFVDGDDPVFCMVCLSQNVSIVLDDTNEGFHEHCESCGLNFRVVEGIE